MDVNGLMNQNKEAEMETRPLRIPSREESLSDLLRNLQGWTEDLDEIGQDELAAMVGNIAGRLERVMRLEGISPAKR